MSKVILISNYFTIKKSEIILDSDYFDKFETISNIIDQYSESECCFYLLRLVPIKREISFPTETFGDFFESIKDIPHEIIPKIDENFKLPVNPDFYYRLYLAFKDEEAWIHYKLSS